MGDPLSATAAVLGLTGIFISCVQCFELIQSGQNFERDLLVLTTKFSNQQLRFTKWGEACGFGSPRGYNRALDTPEFRINIERTFQSIKLLLDSGVAVTQIYNGAASQCEEIVSSQVVSTRWSWISVKRRLRGSQDAQRTMHATKWALSDKKKFDEIIRHLSDLVADLETLTADLGVSRQQRYLVQYEIQSISDTETLELMEAAHMGPGDMVSDTASERLRTIYHRSLNSSRPPGSILDVLSVPETDCTAETYATAHETVQEVADYSESVEVAQNSRLMKDLLIGASPIPKTAGDLTVDISNVGQLIGSLRLDAFDSALELNSGCLYRADQLDSLQRKRLLREIERNAIRSEQRVGTCYWYHVHWIGDDLRYILGNVEGPPNSPYEGGIFQVVLRIGDTYPWKAPDCRMLTKIYHPNIDNIGRICIDILKEQWNPLLTIDSVVTSIGSILDDPGLEDPLVLEIAETYVKDRNRYNENARAYTRRYAREVCPTSETIDRFNGMCKELAGDQLKTHG